MGILHWIRGERSETAMREIAQTEATLERIVALTNPRLTLARRYRQRLLPAVRNAMEYTTSVVASVAPAREASIAAWRSDASMRAFFATPEDLARVFSRSSELRNWFDRNASADEVYAVLSMEMVERRILGVALEGGVLRRDVPQTTVGFSDHRLRICGGSEVELRQKIEQLVVDQLAVTALSLAAQDKSQRQAYEYERALLRARLHLLEQRGAGLTGLTGKQEPSRDEVDRVQSALAVNEANLKSVAAGFEALDHELERVHDVLTHANEYFNLSTKRLRLDRMNVVLSEDTPTPGEPLELHVARIPMPDGDPEFRTVMLVRFARSALLPKGVLMKEAARMLH